MVRVFASGIQLLLRLRFRITSPYGVYIMDLPDGLWSGLRSQDWNLNAGFGQCHYFDTASPLQLTCIFSAICQTCCTDSYPELSPLAGHLWSTQSQPQIMHSFSSLYQSNFARTFIKHLYAFPSTKWELAHWACSQWRSSSPTVASLQILECCHNSYAKPLVEYVLFVDCQYWVGKCGEGWERFCNDK